MFLRALFITYCILIHLSSLAIPTSDIYDNNPANNYLMRADSLIGTENQKASELLDSAFNILQQNSWQDLNAEYFYLKGYLAMSNAEYGISLEYSYKAFDYYKTTDNFKRIADCYYIMGLSNIYNSNPKPGIDELFKAANIYDSLHMVKELIQTQNSLGSGFYHLKEYKKASEFFMKVKIYADQSKDTLNLLTSLNNLGIICDETAGRGNKDAMNYYRQAIGICLKNGMDSELVSLYLNLGLDHFILNNYDSAFYFYSKSKYLAIKYNSLDALLIINVNLGEYYLKTKKFDSAFFYVHNAFEIQNKLGNKLWNKDLYQLKAKISFAKENYKEAFLDLEESINWQDSIYNIQIINTVSEIEAKYESQKKIQLLEQQKTIIETQKSKNRILLALLFLLTLFILLILFYTFKFISINQSLNEKNKIINKTNEELQETIKTRETLTSIIAHDIKNPLSTITGFAELSLTTKTDNIDRYRLFSEQILKSSLSLNELLDNLLDWAKSQNQGIKPNPICFSMEEIINSNTILLHYMLLEKNIRLQIEVKSDHVVIADYQMIHTVFRNLITNAIKYTDRDGLIKIVSTPYNNYLKIDIKDNGIGISEENIPKLFDPKADRRNLSEATNQGSGLGLLLCSDFVKLNQGYIEVRSEIKKGSCFSVFLPRQMQ